MNKISHVLGTIFAVGVLSLGCGLTNLARDVFERIPTPLELYVSTAGNDANDCLSVDTACLTLRAALEKATLSSTIHIGPGEFPVELGLILKSITLIGAGSDQTVLRAAAAAGSYSSDDVIFLVEGQNPVAIRELEISGIRDSSALVGLNVDGGSNLSLENCRVTQAKIGVLIQTAGLVTISNCTIAQNTVGVQIGGDTAHFLKYYGEDLKPSTYHGLAVISNNSIIAENITGISNDGILSLDNVTFEQNSNALYNKGYATVAGSTFGNNGLGGAGNATITNSGVMTISNSGLSNNYPVAILNNVEPYLISAFGETYSPSDRRADLRISNVEIFDNDGNLHTPCAIVNARGRLQIYETNIVHNQCKGLDLYKGKVEIFKSSIVNNMYGGLEARGESSVYLENTTISNNYGVNAIEVDDTAALKLVNVTVAYNHGVGIHLASPGAHLDIWDSVVALNLGVFQCIGGVVDHRPAHSSNYFVCNDTWTATTLGLGPLTEESRTWVHPLLPGSPLIDSGVPEHGCLTSDQRGSSRPNGSNCDVGAYESDRSTAIAPLEFVTPSGGVPGVVPLYTDTPAPTLTPVYTDTPQAPIPIILTFAKNAFCRKGPGSLYRDISSFNQGDTAQADGRNDTDPRWWWVQIPNNTEHCWVSYVTVDPNDLAENLPIQPVALQLPAAPSSFTISKRACSANGYSLQLAWSKSSGADGYTLYLNGQQIATFKANQTTYQEKPPLDKSLHYELEAFNKSGFSSRLVVEDRCP